MARTLHLTRAGEYAIAALARLALETDPTDPRPVPVRTLALRQRIPKSFLSKIIAQCAKAGIVSARKGPTGGVALSRAAADISLLSIIEACEGDYARAACVFFSARPCPGTECEVYCGLRKDEESVKRRLMRTTLAEMAESLRVHPDAKLFGRTGGH